MTIPVEKPPHRSRAARSSAVRSSRWARLELMVGAALTWGVTFGIAGGVLSFAKTQGGGPTQWWTIGCFAVGAVGGGIGMWVLGAQGVSSSTIPVEQPPNRSRAARSSRWARLELTVGAALGWGVTFAFVGGVISLARTHTMSTALVWAIGCFAVGAVGGGIGMGIRGARGVSLTTTPLEKRSSRWAWLALLLEPFVLALTMLLLLEHVDVENEPRWADVLLWLAVYAPAALGALLGLRSAWSGNPYGAHAAALGFAWLAWCAAGISLGLTLEPSTALAVLAGAVIEACYWLRTGLSRRSQGRP